MNDKKNNYLLSIIVLMSVTCFIEILYAYIYTKTSNNGYILFWEALTFMVLIVASLLILKATKGLLNERNFKLYTGTSGLAHSAFMALLVAQRISTNIETTLFVLCIFVVLHLFLILLWYILYKRSQKNTSKKYRTKQRKIIAIFSFMGAFAGIFLVRIFDHDIIMFDTIVSLLSLTYTFFVFLLFDSKHQSGDGSMIES